MSYVRCFLVVGFLLSSMFSLSACNKTNKIATVDTEINDIEIVDKNISRTDNNAKNTSNTISNDVIPDNTTTLDDAISIETINADANDKYQSKGQGIETNKNDFTVSQILSDSIDSKLYEPLLTSGSLTQTQTDCIESRDKTIITDKAQAYYEQHLTADELKQLNDFYQSPAGQKWLAYSNEQSKRRSGLPIENPIQPFSDSELTEIEAFQKLSLDQRLQQAMLAQGDGSLNSIIRPIIEDIIKRCDIDIKAIL